MTISKTPWWKNCSVYQIYPASFKDSNGDGIGDLQGILSKLDHVKDLGIDVVWLSPHYESPQDDMGYDISNYNKIHAPYGDMKDMDQLIDEIHKRGMKIIFDLVVNHTSSEHEWFKESRSSIDNPKRDWYIWKKPIIDSNGERHPPNNWMSHFSGSAWEYDELTNEYYLRLFAKTQPDLNWENEETRNAIYESALNFWYRKGIDGFRIDVAGFYSKDQDFPDAPVVLKDSKWQPSTPFTSNYKRIHEFHKEMYEKCTGNYDAMTVGEICSSSKEDFLKFVGAEEKELNMMFIFDPVEVGCGPSDRFNYIGWELPDFKKTIENQNDYIKDSDAWLTVFLENHDQPRSVSRLGNTSTLELHKRSSKLISLLETTLTGTLFIYQGQEIGMSNVPRSWDISEYKDINTINYWADFKTKYPKDEDKLNTLFDNINLLARDHSRTPIQWDETANAGFSTGKPWMRVNDNYKEINVESQINDSNSILSFWKKALKLRKQYSETFIHGEFEILDFDNKQHFSYTKTALNGDKVYVVLNFSNEPLKFEPLVDGRLELLVSNVDDINANELIPYEGRVYLVN